MLSLLIGILIGAGLGAFATLLLSGASKAGQAGREPAGLTSVDPVTGLATHDRCWPTSSGSWAPATR